MTQLEKLLRECTVKLSLDGYRGWGTGFFVAPDLILTCAHVVRQAANTKVNVLISSKQEPLSATVISQFDDGKTLDISLLALTEPLPNHPCVLLAEAHVEIGQSLYSYGYLESYRNAAPIRALNEGLTGDQPPLIKFQGAQIEGGISGAALLNLETGKVCGMVKETRAQGFALGGGAVPTRVIFEYLPQLKALQDSFHQADSRWQHLLPQQNSTSANQETNNLSSSVWMIPAQRNPFFLGREDALEEMRNALLAGNCAAFCGLGGIGKTQTAIQYAYNYRVNYEHVLWVQAEQAIEFYAGLLKIAKTLRLPLPQERDEGLVVTVLKAWLKQRRNWLLVLDNADDLTLVQPFLRDLDTGHILLTSKAQATGAIKKIEIHKMGREEGALFLLRRAKLIEERETWNSVATSRQLAALNIADQLDGLPLALDQAGAFIEETFTSLEDYLHLYKEEGDKLLAERGELADDHPSVSVTFSLAFEKVMKRNRAAADLIIACAFLAPNAIPDELFKTAISELGEHLAALKDNPLALTKVFAEASRFSLLQRDRSNQTISIHRLVQKVLRSRLKQAEYRLWIDRIGVSLNQLFPRPDYKNWATCNRFLAHSKQVHTHAKSCDLNSLSMATLSSKTGQYLRQQGQYDEAKSFLESSLYLHQQILGEKHLSIATSKNHLAGLYKDQGLYEKSESLYREALEMRLLLLGQEHVDTATSWNDLGVFLRLKREYKEAEALHLKALATRKKLLGEQHLDVTESLSNLGVLYFGQGFFNKAKKLFEEAFAYRKKSLGEYHPRTINSLSHIASIYTKERQFKKAEEIYLKIEKISKQVFGEVNDKRAAYLNNLADIYVKTGNFSLAEKRFKEALEMQKKCFGEEHLKVAIILNNLGALSEELEEFDKAESYYSQALSIKIKISGEETIPVGISLNNLAKLYVKLIKYEKAKELYLKTLKIFSSKLDINHPDYLKIQDNLTELLDIMHPEP